MIRELVLLAAAAAVSPAFAQPAADPAYRVTRPADRITCLSPGLETSPITTCVIESGAGLVVVDTGLSPSMAKRTRARIAKELGRDDIRWVINTHSHFDHTGGNQVYGDALIIGHDNAPPAMMSFYDDREAWIEARLRWLQRQEANAGPDQTAALEERLAFNREMIADLRTGFTPAPPTLTFSDRLSLRAGEIEIRLLFFGRAHTEADILILIPELKTLFTGDLFHDEVLGVASGSQPLEVDRWLEVLDFVLDGDNIETVVGGHGLVFTPEWIRAQRQYLVDVWQAVNSAKDAGKSLAELSLELQPDDRFSALTTRLGLSADEFSDQHSRVLQTMWRGGQVSAADDLGRVAREVGVEAVLSRWAEIRSDAHFYVDENELNALGYALLQRERKVPEALAVFEINTEAFPDSWNVWDSYAEAHWWIDDQDGVERNYRKALELNPAAESARRAISQIEGYRLDRAGETGVRLMYEAGAPTGLQGPYFDQKPPGIEPRIFAPGIVSTAEGFEYSIAFSPDGREVFFTRRIEPDGLNTLWVARLGDDGWTAPEPAKVSEGRGANEPHISPAGELLYYGSQPPQGPGPGIWVSTRHRDGWSEPEFWGRGMFATSTGNGDLFMWDPEAGRGGAIVRHPRTENSWGPAERLGGGVNEPLPGVHGWVDPDGGFIVFDSYQRPGAQGGEGDLFVAFRNGDGSWGEAFNLGDEVNTPGTNFCPALSPDGKYLFYATNRDIYWVSAEVIHRLRPE